MNNDNVVGLRTIPGNLSNTTTDESYLNAIVAFLQESDALDAEIDYDFVELAQGQPDETVLGPLTSLEKTCFTIAKILDQTIKDELINVEANATHEISEIMRRDKVGMVDAASVYAKESKLPEDVRAFLSLCSISFANVNTMYEWGVRARYNVWTGNLIIRKGHVAHCYE